MVSAVCEGAISLAGGTATVGGGKSGSARSSSGLSSTELGGAVGDGALLAAAVRESGVAIAVSNANEHNRTVNRLRSIATGRKSVVR